MLLALLIAAAPQCGKPEVCFSPGGACDQRLVAFIGDAKETLDVAIYSLNRVPVVDALIAAHGRGVAVRVMIDATQARARKERAAVARLVAADIPVRRNRHRGVMHLKVTLADGERLETGSFNYTTAATELNDENMLVWSCPHTVATYAAEFEKRWAKFAVVAPR